MSESLPPAPAGGPRTSFPSPCPGVFSHHCAPAVILLERCLLLATAPSSGASAQLTFAFPLRPSPGPADSVVPKGNGNVLFSLRGGQGRAGRAVVQSEHELAGRGTSFCVCTEISCTSRHPLGFRRLGRKPLYTHTPPSLLLVSSSILLLTQSSGQTGAQAQMLQHGKQELISILR